MSAKDPYKSIFGTNATDRSVMTPDELDLLDGLCEEADNHRGLTMERASVALIARLARELGDCRKRAPAVQATADADEAERELKKLEADCDQLMTERDEAEEAISQAYFLVTGRSPEWSNLFGHAEALEEIEDALILLRKAVSPKAGRPQWMKEADCLLDRVAYELSQASMSAKLSDYMRAQMKRWSQALKEFRLVHLQPSSPPAVSVGEQEKERE